MKSITSVSGFASQRSSGRVSPSSVISAAIASGSRPAFSQASVSFCPPPQQKSSRCRKKTCVATGCVVASCPRVSLVSIMSGRKHDSCHEPHRLFSASFSGFVMMAIRSCYVFHTMVMNLMSTGSGTDALLSIALDLTASLASRDRLARLLTAVRGAIPCDAAAVLSLVGDDLIPVATHGLAPEVQGRRFSRREHPRLDVVIARKTPVRFPADSSLPDPYDGLLLANPDATRNVHACLGCPLIEGKNVI